MPCVIWLELVSEPCVHTFSARVAPAGSEPSNLAVSARRRPAQDDFFYFGERFGLRAVFMPSWTSALSPGVVYCGLINKVTAPSGSLSLM